VTVPPQPDPRTSLSALAEPVRAALYAHAHAHGAPLGRDEAAAALGIGRSLAAYHLDRLAEAGLLSVSYARRGGRSGPGAGRPAKLYRPTGPEAQVSVPPRDYGLAAGLLAEAAAADSAGASESLRAAAGRRGRALAGGAPSGAPAAPALERVLREQGYEPRRLEDGALVLGNCPFHAIAERHPAVVCEMNAALCEGIVAGLGGDAGEVALEPGRGRCCVVVRPGGRAAGPRTARDTTSAGARALTRPPDDSDDGGTR
jgi:predicted ArsR family transcriptional regulator